MSSILTEESPYLDVNQPYEKYIFREDYASDAAAGTALLALLEDDTVESLFIGNGTYDIGSLSSDVVFGASYNKISGESSSDALITFSRNTSTATDVLFEFDTSAECKIENLKFQRDLVLVGDNFGYILGTGSGSVVFSDNVHLTHNNANINGRGWNADNGDLYLRNSFILGCGVAAVNAAKSVDNCVVDWGSDTFLSCSNLSNITFNNLRVSSSAIGGFDSCQNVSNVVLKDGFPGNITSISTFFSLTDNISNVHLDVASIDLESALYMFSFCDNITNVKIKIDSLTFADQSASNFRFFDRGVGVSNVDIDVTFDLNWPDSGGSFQFFAFLISSSISSCDININYNGRNDDESISIFYYLWECYNVSSVACVGDHATFDGITNGTKIRPFDDCAALSACSTQIEGPLAAATLTTAAYIQHYRDCNWVSGCVADGVNHVNGGSAEQQATGFSTCSAVTGCHVQDVYLAYNSIDGIGNTWNNVFDNENGTINTLNTATSSTAKTFNK